MCVTCDSFKDALYMGVPMISLLGELKQESDPALGSSLTSADINLRAGTDSFPSESNVETRRTIPTTKLASRVGASLLNAVDLDGLVYPDLARYEDAMVRCALDDEWFSSIVQKLISAKDSSPLFDTERWIRNLEVAFRKMLDIDGNYPDIAVADDS